MIQLTKLVFPIVLVVSSYVHSTESLTEEPNGNSYHFVTHYRVEIEADNSIVWEVLIDLKSWMYDFDLTTESGKPGTPGQVLNLYEGQNFKLQVTAAEPGSLLAVANLPITFNGEYGTGVGIFTLHAASGRTEVSLTGSRRYTWNAESANKFQARRASKDFQDQTGKLWHRFLNRLKVLSEERANSDA